MSYLEFFGTLFSLASVFLMTRKNIWTWPTGLIGVVLSALIFYQIRLYADFLEQIYYFFASLYGWWFWVSRGQSGDVREPRFSPRNELWLYACVTLFAALVFSALLTRVHEFFPLFFPEPSSFPWIDGITTVLSFTAMILSARKRTENWIYWIAVNVMSVWLYYVKDVKFIAALYFVYLILAFVGLTKWTSNRLSRKVPNPVLP